MACVTAKVGPTPGPSRPLPRRTLTLSGPNSFSGFHGLSLPLTCRQTRQGESWCVLSWCVSLLEGWWTRMRWAAWNKSPASLRAAPPAGPACLVPGALVVFGFYFSFNPWALPGSGFLLGRRDAACIILGEAAVGKEQGFSLNVRLQDGPSGGSRGGCHQSDGSVQGAGGNPCRGQESPRLAQDFWKHHLQIHSC